MRGKERPVLVAVITTMGVIIAALITSGYWSRTSAEKRENTLESRVKFLEQELAKHSTIPSTLCADTARADAAERALNQLQRKVDQLDSCPQAMFLGKLVRIVYEPAYAAVAADLGSTLRAAGATVEASEFVSQQADHSPRLGTIYYRDGDLAEKARAMQRLLRSKYEAQIKQGNWVFSDSDFAIWVGQKGAG